MAYEGEELNFCPPNMFDFSNASAVVVSGDGPNVYGHMLLNTGGPGGVYFQIVDVLARPRYMTEDGYQRYLSETRKRELHRIPVFIPNPPASQLKLEQILSDSWAWGVVVHNCVTMVEDIIVAGGGPKLHRGLLSLPTLAGWDAWSCGARDCPTHSRRAHRCASGVWWCNRVIPECPGHSNPKDVCAAGQVWTCYARACPNHNAHSHQCRAGVWSCTRRVPPCPSHSRPNYHCAEVG